MVNSETPACKNEPEKSPFLNAVVFFRNPSVLSEFDKSAEETIIFSTCPAKAAKTVDEAARDAIPAFCTMALKSNSGVSFEKNFSNLAANSGFSFAHAACFAFFTAAAATNSLFLFLKKSSTSGKIRNGFSTSPPRFSMVFSNEPPASPNGIPWVETLRSNSPPLASNAPLPIIVLPMMSVGFSFSSLAAFKAERMASMLFPSMVITFHPQASYFLAVSSCVTWLVSVES